MQNIDRKFWNDFFVEKQLPTDVLHKIIENKKIMHEKKNTICISLNIFYNPFTNSLLHI